MLASIGNIVIATSIVAVALTTPLAGQTGRLNGTVIDSMTGQPIEGVRVNVLSSTGTLMRLERTNRGGAFFVRALPSGLYTITVSRVGYRAHSLDNVAITTSVKTVQLTMVAAMFALDAIVVSAARSDQNILDAAAAVSVVDRDVIEQSATLTPIEYVRNLPGVDFATKGLIQHTFSTRGNRGASSGALLMMTDYRYAGVPSIGINIPYLVPATDDDLERIEVVRGPGAALYGPSSHQGVLHFVTRSPFESTGGTVSLMGGPERSLFNVAGRYAARIGPRLAFKLSGKYFRGEDWEFNDPQELDNRTQAIALGANPDTLLIAQRDFNIENASGEARLDYRPDPNTELVMSMGVAQAISNIDQVAAVGAVQSNNWRYSYGQLRFSHKRLFGNIIYNWNDAGDSYLLRTGNQLIDESRLFAAQLQHSAALGDIDLLYGADLRSTDPRTGGTIHGRNEDDDLLTEVGGYGHGTLALSSTVDMIVAGRVDYHDRLNDALVFSPRIGLVFQPGEGHAFRFTYNRAFNSPDPSDLFLDTEVGSLPGLPYLIRVLGSNRERLTFRRDQSDIGLPCGSICMRSPFFPNPNTYIPADATLLWDQILAILGIPGIPAPTASEVGSVFGALNLGTNAFDQISVADIQDLPAGKRTITDALEIGYKGLIADNVFAAVDVYAHRVTDLTGERFLGTPNVFFDAVALTTYLENFMASDQAVTLAATMSEIPMGTVSPDQATDPTDLLIFNRQGGSYTFWSGLQYRRATLNRLEYRRKLFFRQPRLHHRSRRCRARRPQYA